MQKLGVLSLMSTTPGVGTQGTYYALPTSSARVEDKLAAGNWNFEEAKKFESEQTTEYRWQYGVTHKKGMELAKAKEKMEVLKDYSVLLSGCDRYGTGWFLDYVLPDKRKGEKYPTRWFIGTAAHVARHFIFDPKNPYNELLPKGGNTCGEGDDEYGITLGKEKSDVSDWIFDRSNFKTDFPTLFDLRYWNRQYEVIKKKDSKDAEKVDKWWFWAPKPKLVYAPHHYLIKEQKNYSKYNYKLKDYAVDFAVVEVDFKDEKVAKLFTRDFYGKYNRENGTKKSQALNFFAKPLLERYINKQLLDQDVQVLGVGYPVNNGIPTTASTNYNIKHHEASRFSYYRVRTKNQPELKDSKGEDLLGHIDMWILSQEGWDKNVMWDWAGMKMHTRGYGYVIEENALSPGASGGIYVMDDGSALGTLSFVNRKTDQAFLSALRNKEMKDRDGRILYPAYDVLEGAKDQMISYKSKIQDYVLSQCKQTELSRLRKWENIMGDCSKSGSSKTHNRFRDEL